MKTIIEHISDTHNNYDLPLKGGHILIHSGDATSLGGDFELKKLNEFFKKVKNNYEHIVFVPGNHDLSFETNEKRSRKLVSKGVPNLIILINESVDLRGIKIFGSPCTPTFKNWAFMKSEDKLFLIWEKIPLETQLLITHGPAQGILDYVPISAYNYQDKSAGSSSLRWVIDNILKKIKLHCFGHIHESAGAVFKYGIHFINAATTKNNSSRFTNGFISIWEDGEVIDVSPNEG